MPLSTYLAVTQSATYVLCLNSTFCLCTFLFYEETVNKVQCQHLMPAINAWATWALNMTAHSIVTKCPGHGHMDGLTTESGFDLQSYVGHQFVWLTFLTYYPGVFVQPCTGRRLVDWCRN